MSDRRILTGALMAIVLTVGGVACGGDESSSTTEPSVPDTTTGDAAEEAAGRSDLRDERYCEIIPVTRERATFTAKVYNTLGLNDCPPELWDELTEDWVNAAYGSVSAEMNGPRFWTLDRIVGSGSSTTGEVFDFDGIEMELRATIEMGVLDGRSGVGAGAYSPNEIQRDTVFVFEADKPVFELTSPEGEVYVMQSYTQLVDPDLSYADLEALGDRLELPEGWTYSTRVLDEEYSLDSGGLAFVIQDDFLNSYQRRT